MVLSPNSRFIVRSREMKNHLSCGKAEGLDSCCDHGKYFHAHGADVGLDLNVHVRMQIDC
jgi:hypothetical protein